MIVRMFACLFGFFYVCFVLCCRKTVVLHCLNFSLMYIFVSNIVNNCVTRTIFPMYRNGKWFSLLWCLYVTTIGCMCCIAVCILHNLFIYLYSWNNQKRKGLFSWNAAVGANVVWVWAMGYGVKIWKCLLFSFVSAAMCSNKYGKRNEKYNPTQSTTTTIDEEKGHPEEMRWRMREKKTKARFT